MEAQTLTTITPIITAVLSLLTVLMVGYNGKKQFERSLYNSAKLEDMHETMTALEKNTDGIKDALVAATYKEGHYEGVREQLIKSNVKAFAVAEGVRQGRKSKRSD